MGLLVGIDIGGTFTDIIVCDLSGGGIRAAKVATTPRDYGEGVMNALEACGLSPKAVEEIVHGTTVATNALIQGKVAPCGLITTRGFRDLLDLRKRDRPVPFGLHPPFEPLIPRNRRVEVNERTGPDGRVVIRVDEEEALSAARRLIDMGAECIAISFLHGPKGKNERKAAECIRKALPSIPVSVGGEVCPGGPEFERTSTAASNAAVTPLVRDYLDNLSVALSGEGFTGILRLVESNGRLLREDSERFQAISTALSGPSAGVIGAAALCRSLGFQNFVTADMGGTSFDSSIVQEGKPALTRNREIRFGLPIAIPMLDISAVGAGGGSIARVDPDGFLKVGPDSVGAFPGPVCYGRQKYHPTVADADLLMGRIDPKAQFIPGRRLDFDAARRVVAEKIGRPYRLKEVDASANVGDAVDAKMADAIRFMAARRCLTLEGFILVAYGGAGPLHAACIAKELGFKKVVVPHRAGVFSACGGLTIRVSEDKIVKLMSRDGTGEGARSTEDAKIGERAVHFGGKFYQSNLYDRERLPEGANLHGPAIVEESGSTTSIPPGTMAEVVAGGHLVMEVE